MGLQTSLADYANDKLALNEPMKRHTSLGVGGNARYYAEVYSLYSLNGLIETCRKHKLSYKIIGNGTNVLFADGVYNGLVINTCGLADVFFKKNEVLAMAGASLSKLANFAFDNGLTGLEPLSGIPATVGGAIVMNAGAFGHNIADIVTSVTTVKNGEFFKYDKHLCRFGYRKSRFLGKREAVAFATFNLAKSDKAQIELLTKEYSAMRRACQPLGKTCGSVFKNPKGNHAGKLIELAGLKDLFIGGARVSNIHANFIVCDKTATAQNVYNLIQTIKQTVHDKFGVLLSEEIEYIGDF